MLQNQWMAMQSSLDAFQSALQASQACVTEIASRGLFPTPYEVFKAGGNGLGDEHLRMVAAEVAELLPGVLLGSLDDILEAQAISGLDNAQLKRLETKAELLSASAWYRLFLSSLRKGYGFISYPGYPLINPRVWGGIAPSKIDAYFSAATPSLYLMNGLELDGSPVPGWLCFLQVRPKDLVGNPEILRTRALKAATLLEKLGASIVGLGGLTAALTDGGW